MVGDIFCELVKIYLKTKVDSLHQKRNNKCNFFILFISLNKCVANVFSLGKKSSNTKEIVLFLPGFRIIMLIPEMKFVSDFNLQS